MKIIALAAVAAGTLWAGSAAAQTTREYTCPEQTRSTVTHNGDAAWTATNHQSAPTGATMERMGGTPIMVCHYRLMNTDYWIWQRPPADMPVCTVLRRPQGDDRRAVFTCRQR